LHVDFSKYTITLFRYSSTNFRRAQAQGPGPMGAQAVICRVLAKVEKHLDEKYICCELRGMER